MIRRNPQGDYPKIEKTAYIDPSAVVIGKVRIGKNVFVAPGVVIRADEQKSSIAIGDNCNVQDRVIIHALGKSLVVIGENTSLSHGCIIHGPCSIGRYCFIGFGSVVFKARLNDNVFVGFMATVSGVTIPSLRLILDEAVVNSSQKTKHLGVISKECRKFTRSVLRTNLDLAKGYKKEV